MLNITFLKTGFTVIQWENENSVSIVKKIKLLAPWSQKKEQQLAYWLVQTTNLQFWNFVVSTNCNIHYMIKILPENRYNSLIKLT